MNRSISGLLAMMLLLSTAGCPAPTPGERVRQLGGVVTERGDGVVDLDLSGKSITDQDIVYINAFCSNDARWTAIHTLDLSDTGITDKALEKMMQKGFSSPEGLQVLVIRNTDVSERAIKDFQAACPDCEVIR